MKKWLNKLLIITFVAFTLISPIQVQAAGKNRYYAVALANPNSMMTSYQIFKVDDNVKPSTYGKYIGSVSTSGQFIAKSEEYDKYKWPNIPYSNESDSSAKPNDEEQAENVMSEAVNQLNTLINWLDRWSAEGLASGNSDVSNLYENIAALLSKGEATIAGTTFVTEDASEDDKVVKKLLDMSKKPNAPLKGISVEDFKTIVPTGLSDVYSGKDSKVTILINLPKGYSTDDTQRFKVEKTTGYTVLKLSDLASTISKAYEKNLTFDDFTVKSSTAGMMDEMFGGFSTGTMKFLGFYEPEDLVFNGGDRDSGYYLGLMPNSWWNTINQFFWVAEIIAILILFLSVINMIFKQNLATISPTIRNSLKDSIAQLGIAIIMLLAYVPIFYIMAKTNSIIVEMFSSFSESFTFSNSAPSLNWLLKFILFFINCGLIVKLNIDYFVRSVMISFLHATAPIFISSIAMGPNGKQMFNSWLREMIGSIFMQGFNAMILAIMVVTVGTGVGTKWWHTQAMVFMLSSLNTWFRNLIGVGDTIASIGGQVKQQADRGFEPVKKAAGMAAGVAVGGVVGGATGIVGGMSSESANVATKNSNTLSSVQSGGTVNFGGENSGSSTNLEKGNVATMNSQKSESTQTSSKTGTSNSGQSSKAESFNNAQTAKAETNSKITNFAKKISKETPSGDNGDYKPSSSETPKNDAKPTSDDTSTNSSDLKNKELQAEESIAKFEESNKLEEKENKLDSITPDKEGGINSWMLGKNVAKSIINGNKGKEESKKSNTGEKAKISDIGVANETLSSESQSNITSKEARIKEAQERMEYERKMGISSTETQNTSISSTSINQSTPISKTSTTNGISNNPDNSTITPSLDIDTSDRNINDEKGGNPNVGNRLASIDSEQTTERVEGRLNDSPINGNIDTMTPEEILNNIDESKLTDEQKKTFNELKQENEKVTADLNNSREAYVQELQQTVDSETKKARVYGKVAQGLNAFSQSMIRNSLRGTGLDAVVDEYSKTDGKREKYRDMAQYDPTVGKVPNNKTFKNLNTEKKDNKEK